MKTTATFLAAALALALGACETATPYQPLVPTSAAAGGFTDQKLDDTHYRVTFRGNDVTSRDAVETYLLYRAAELTASSGFDWFEMVDRHTRDRGYAYLERDFPYRAGWSPYWRFHGRLGWAYWDPYWGSPFWGGGYDVERIDEYEAVAEIAVAHGARPANDPRAFDARQLMQNLEPKIVRPK
jgi:hypothetical protein